MRDDKHLNDLDYGGINIRHGHELPQTSAMFIAQFLLIVREQLIYDWENPGQASTAK